MPTDAITRLLQIATELQEIADTDPHAFGDGHESDAVKTVIEAWDATSALMSVFLTVVKHDYGIKDQ